MREETKKRDLLLSMVDPYTSRQEASSLPIPTNGIKSPKKLLTGLEREMNSRIQDSSQLLENLKELGMVGDFFHDERYVSSPFEDVHRLVTTMRIAELILNERVQTRRKAKISQIKTQLDVSALLVELERAKQSLTQKQRTPSGLFKSANSS